MIPIKYVVALGAVVGVLLGAVQLTNHIYDAGRESMRLEIAEANSQTQKAQTQKALADIVEDGTDAAARAEVQRTVEVKTVEVVKYVTRTIKVPADCSPLAADVVRVLHDTTDAIRAAGSKSAD